MNKVGFLMISTKYTIHDPVMRRNNRYSQICVNFYFYKIYIKTLSKSILPIFVNNFSQISQLL